MNNTKDQNIFSEFVKLEDYKEFDYEIPEIFLNFVIKKNEVDVTTILKLIRRNKNSKNLILDGKDILIKKIILDESLLNKKNYILHKDYLIINNINKNSFSLKIEGIPFRNV